MCSSSPTLQIRVQHAASAQPLGVMGPFTRHGSFGCRVRSRCPGRQERAHFSVSRLSIGRGTALRDITSTSWE